MQKPLPDCKVTKSKQQHPTFNFKETILIQKTRYTKTIVIIQNIFANNFSYNQS